MTNIIPFEFENNKIRTVIDKGDSVWFVAKDVAEALGYENTSKAIGDHCDEVTKRYPIPDSLGRKQDTLFINEPNLYRLIVKSKLPTAKKFERWVFSEVLPTIRKTGSYSVKPKASKPVSPLSYIKVHQYIKQTLSQAGLEENQLLLATNKGATKLTGFDLLDSAGITYLPSPHNDEYLTPTQIGRQLNPPISPREVNRRLLNFGLQIGRSSGGYIPTLEGKELGARMMDVSKSHTEGSTQQLKFHSSIVELLQNSLKEGT